MTAARPLAAIGVLLAIGGARHAGDGAARFRDVAADAGLLFQHINGAAGAYHLPEIMGAGAALFDYDSDGDLDVLVLQGRPIEGGASPASGRPRLFRNDVSSPPGAASLHFTDITDRAGLASDDYGMGVAVGDYDNDGDPDLYVTNYGPNRLYRNNGDGTFTDVTRAAGEGMDDPRWSTSATFSDYDADGDLDLFVANYVDYSIAGSRRCSDPTGARDYCGPLQFRPVPGRLFRNNGNGTFADVSEASRVTTAYGSGLGVISADLTGDRRPDFYVANDGRPNQLWINKGDGTFEDGALLAGVALNMDGVAEGSMGLAVGDPDNDGDLDIFVTNITGESHAFYENDGRGQFQDRRLTSGIGASTLRSTGFGTDWFDYDSDGWVDLFIANGGVTIIEALRGDPFPFRQPNQLLRNIDGRHFRDVSLEAGAALRLSEVSRGAAFGDLDNDGDVDVLVTNNGGPLRLLLNETALQNHWLAVRLEGVTDNRQGLGARVGVVTGDITVWRRAHTDGSYLCANDPRVHFGLGKADAAVRLIVEWPRGMREAWSNVLPDRSVTLKQGTGTPVQ
jgi:hypothetical protein